MPNETTGKLDGRSADRIETGYGKKINWPFSQESIPETGERTWVFYTRNIPAFGRMLNETRSVPETLPLTIYTEKDPEWNEYRENVRASRSG